MLFADASGFTRLTETLTQSPRLGEKQGTPRSLLLCKAEHHQTDGGERGGVGGQFHMLDRTDRSVLCRPLRSLAGAEELCKILNKFFARMIEITDAFGGDVVKVTSPRLFAHKHASPAQGPGQPPCKGAPQGHPRRGMQFSGDAISVIWYVDLDEAKRTGGYISADLKTAALRAVACSIEIHEVTVQRHGPAPVVPAPAPAPPRIFPSAFVFCRSFGPGRGWRCFACLVVVVVVVSMLFRCCFDVVLLY